VEEFDPATGGGVLGGHRGAGLQVETRHADIWGKTPDGGYDGIGARVLLQKPRDISNKPIEISLRYVIHTKF